ncbi:MAG: AraC family transcriptional regulator [Opitutales bacterium]|nr:AraC family transcriptional regulator [Opitutales bacterium]
MRACLEPLSLGSARSFRFIEIDQNEGFDGHWHYHPEVELKWVTSGTGRRIVGDKIQPFGPSDLVLLGTNLPHCWRTDTNCLDSSTASVVQFRQESLEQKPELVSLHSMINSADTGLYFPLDEKHQREALGERFSCLNQASPGSWKAYVAWMDLLGLVSTFPREIISSKPVTMKKLKDDRLAKVINFILDRLEQPFDSVLFVDAFQLVGMSPSAFSRFFKRHTGQTFSRFVNEIRISKSTSLMLDSKQTILTISLESGFGSLSHYNRVFTEIKGISPGQWRKEMNKTI